MSVTAVLARPILAILALLGAILLLVVPSATPTMGPMPGELSGTSGWVCAKPASVDVPLAAPNGTSPAHSVLTIKIEFRIANYTNSTGRIQVYAPSLFATIPVASGRVVRVYTSPQSAALSNGAWSALSVAKVSKTLSTSTQWPSSGTAYLSSELLAVMATVTNYHALNLSIRWMWNLSQSTGSLSSGWSGWSVVRGCPSSFDPAPYVSLASTSPTTLASGSNFTVSLRGFTAQQPFTLKLENSSTGHTYNVQTGTCPAGNVSPCNLSIAMVNGPNQGIASGSYLVHVHNAVGSLDFSLSVRVR